MMRVMLEEIMSQVTVDTLEKLAFMFAFPGEGEVGGPKDSMVAGSVSFSGPFSGTLIMAISFEVLQELTANMLGLDDAEESTESQRYDALKETLNVICGNLLPAITGDEVIFDIGVPEVFPSDSESKSRAGIPNEAEPSARVTLEFDEGQSVISLFLNGEIPEGLISLQPS